MSKWRGLRELGRPQRAVADALLVLLRREEAAVVEAQREDLQATQIGKATDSVLLRRLIPKIMWYVK